MKLRTSKLLILVNNKIARLEQQYKRDLVEWKKDLIDDLKATVENTKKEVKEREAQFIRVSKPNWVYEDTYYGNRPPKPPKSQIDQLIELRALVELVSEEDVTVTPKIERALGLDFK